MIAAVADPSPALGLWEWFSTTTTVDNLITTLGVATLAILFARDRIITRGQHDRRISDLVTNQEKAMKDLKDHHARELAEKDASHERERDSWSLRYDDQKLALQAQREATREERERADSATVALGQIAGVLEANVHALESLDEAVTERGGS